MSNQVKPFQTRLNHVKLPVGFPVNWQSSQAVTHTAWYLAAAAPVPAATAGDQPMHQGFP